MQWDWKKHFGIKLIVTLALLGLAYIFLGSLNVADTLSHHFVSMVPLFLIIDGISSLLIVVMLWKVVQQAKVSKCSWVVFVCWHCVLESITTIQVYVIALGQPVPDISLDNRRHSTSYNEHRELLISIFILVTIGLIHTILTSVWLWAVWRNAKSEEVPYRKDEADIKQQLIYA